MGNLCGKQSSSDNFSSPGRAVGSAPPPGPRTAPVPSAASGASKTKAQKVGGPPRTLGGGSSDQQTPEEARRKAAEAAEARATAKNAKGGKLASNLAAQKKQTRTDTLNEASQQNLQQRESDADAKLRQYD